MAEQVLDIELPGMSTNRPGGEGVAEAVRMHVLNAGLKTVTTEHEIHMVVLDWPAIDRLEERSGFAAPEPVQIVLHRFESEVADGGPALLLTLPL